MNIGIIGYGRFGQLWADLLSGLGHTVFVYDTVPITARSNQIRIVDFDCVLQVQWLFLAVPISTLEACCKKITDLIPKKTVVIDLCSVKVYPAKIMQQFLPPLQPLVATHPLFGPDSVVQSGVRGKNIAVCPLRVSPKEQSLLDELWHQLGLQIVYTTPEDHDRVMARTQALVHFIGRGLEPLNLQSEVSATPDYQSLLHIQSMVSHDTWQLFYDMQLFNPYVAPLRHLFLQELQELEKNIRSQSNRAPLEIGDASSIDIFRTQIDQLDEELLHIVSHRFQLVNKIGAIKKQQARDIEDVDRDQDVKDHYLHVAKQVGISEIFVRSLCRLVLGESKRMQK